MEFRSTRVEDLPAIMDIVSRAKVHMKQSGIEQWQNNYPTEQVFLEDIKNKESYVMTLDGKVVGTVAISFREEKNYDEIIDGQWLNQTGEYAVVHRVAVDDRVKGQGIAGKLIYQVEHLKHDGISSVRIDTHKDNLAMQRTIEKSGFKYCGKTKIFDGSERMSFEKML